METHSDLMYLVMAAIFVIVLIVSYKSLSQAFNFGDGMTFMLAICVAGLSIIGLSDMAATVESSENSSGFSFEIDTILLPYILLALAIIAGLITRVIKRFYWYSKWRKEYKQRPDTKQNRSM